jgi:hypothetical protein
VGRSGAVGRWLRRLAVAALVWTLLNLGAVLVRWTQTLTAPIGPSVQTVQLDLRQDRSTPGVVVTLVGTRPTPARGDLFGHMWVVWPVTPPQAPAGTFAAGYYAGSHVEAAGAMAVAMLAPWGWLTGQVPVPGTLKADDGWWRHFEIQVRTDRAGLARALAVDGRWRSETRYALRPGSFGVGLSRTVACQDYVLEVAAALGLTVPARRDWTLFPIGSFRELARANGLESWMDAVRQNR